MLKKKQLSVAVAYHKVHDSCAKVVSRFAYHPIATNLDDICTKVLTPELKQLNAEHILY